jgi:hypothetical protein
MFILDSTVIMIVNHDHYMFIFDSTVNCHYDCKLQSNMFIVQAIGF